MVDPPLRHRHLQRLHRRIHTHKPLPKLHHLRPLLQQLVARARRIPRVISQLLHLEPRQVFPRLRQNELIVHHIPRRHPHPPLPRPHIIRNPIPLHPLPHVLLRNPEPAHHLESPLLPCSPAPLQRGENPHQSSDIQRRRQVQPPPTLPPRQLRLIHRPPIAPPPRLRVDPPRRGLRPHIQLLLQKPVQPRRHPLRHPRLVPQVIQLLANPQIRIRLIPTRLRLPIIQHPLRVPIQRIDQPMPAIILQHPTDHLLRVIMKLPTDRLPITPRRRHRIQQRLPPRPRRRLQHIPHIPVRMRVQFIDDSPMHIQPIQRPRVPAQRLELRERLLAVDIVLEKLQLPPQRRRLLHHPHRLLVHNPRLIPLRRRRVNLRPRLPIRRLKIQPHPRPYCRLPILTTHLKVARPEPPRPIRPLPPEQTPQMKLLPRLQLDRLPRPLPLAVPQQPKERQRQPPRPLIEPQPPPTRLLQIPPVPLASQPHPPAFHPPAGEHIIHIPFRLRTRHHAPLSPDSTFHLRYGSYPTATASNSPRSINHRFPTRTPRNRPCLINRRADSGWIPNRPATSSTRA